MIVRTVLIDDESSARETLQFQLQHFLPQVQVVGVAESVESGIATIEKCQPDLVFLDIEMPLGSGFDILDATKHLKFQVIFITAFGHYALQAFKFSAAAYLMKPVRIGELKEAVERVFTPESMAGSVQKIQALGHNLSTAGAGNPRLVLPELTGFVVVEVSSIVRCEGERNYTRFHFADQSTVLVTRTLKEYDDTLSPHGFFRIHQSHLINLAYVKRYIRGTGGEVEMTDKSMLPLSRYKKEEFLKHFDLG